MNDSLVFDLVEWIAKRERSYAEVMETWRTSCPRLTIWEDALDRRLVERRTIPGRGVVVTVTAQGLEFLANDQPQHEVGAPRPLRLS